MITIIELRLARTQEDLGQPEPLEKNDWEELKVPLIEIEEGN